jgi:hypothetical protein
MVSCIVLSVLLLPGSCTKEKDVPFPIIIHVVDKGVGGVAIEYSFSSAKDGRGPGSKQQAFPSQTSLSSERIGETTYTSELLEGDHNRIKLLAGRVPSEGEVVSVVVETTMIVELRIVFPKLGVESEQTVVKELPPGRYNLQISRPVSSAAAAASSPPRS